MATATNLTSSERTKVLEYTHSSATVMDTIYLLGGRVLVALAAAGANVANMYIYGSDRIEMPKASGTGTGITAGATLYWDDTNKVVTTASTGNTKCGMATEDAASTASVVEMELNNAVNF